MRLIDADALKLSMMLITPGETVKYCYPCKEFLEAIENAPTVQPASDIFTENETMRKIIHERVLDGEWETMGDFLGSKRCRCSKCGIEVILNDRNRSKYNFSPNCGADMRGKNHVTD